VLGKSTRCQKTAKQTNTYFFDFFHDELFLNI